MATRGTGGRVVKNSGLDARAVRNELVLALHEIGTSLRFGWGVPKDKKAVRDTLLLFVEF